MIYKCHLLTVLCSKSTLSTSQSPSNTPHLMASLQRFYQPLWVDSQPPIPPQSKVLRVLYPKRIPKTVGSLKHNLHNQFLSRLCFPFCSRPRFSCSPVFLLCVLKGIIKITCCLCIAVHSHQFPRDTHKYSWYTHGYFMNLPWILIHDSWISRGYLTSAERSELQRSFKASVPLVTLLVSSFDEPLMVSSAAEAVEVAFTSPTCNSWISTVLRFDQIKSHRHKANISKQYTGAIYLYIYIYICT